MSKTVWLMLAAVALFGGCKSKDAPLPDGVFKAQDAKAEFLRFLSSRGVALTDLTPNTGVEAMLTFYERQPAHRVSDADDTLLFQWGTHDWGKGKSFEVDITRQLALGGDEGGYWQLSLTFHYAPTDEFNALKSQNGWCESRKKLPAFRSFVQEAPPLPLVGDVKAREVTLEWGSAE